MQRGAIVWIALLAVLVGGMVYEFPNAVLNLRHLRNTWVGVADHVDRVVSDRLIASDREAGEILRYAIKRRANYASRRDLRDLVQEHPENEFFLAELLERLAEKESADLSEMLAISDRLLALDPNNAHYRYLRGWVLLKTPDGNGRLAEALEQFELGDRLAYLSLPYRKYKERVDRIAERAVLDKYDRPRIEAFYPDLGGTLASEPRWRNVDQDLRGRLLAAGSRIAARVIRSAYDLDSLYSGARMMQAIQEAKLRELPLSDFEKALAGRWRESARALDDFRWEWGRRLWVTSPNGTDVLPWLILVAALVSFFRLRFQLAWPQIATPAKAPSALAEGTFTLVSLVVFMAAYKWNLATRSGVIWVQTAWFVSLFCWCFSPEAIAYADGAKGTASRPIRSWPATVYALLWFDGVIILSISNSDFFGTGGFSGWSRGIPILAIWSAFWALLWLSTRDRQPVFGRMPYRMAVALAFSAALLVLTFDALGGRWRWESRAYAEALSLCPSLPPLVEEIRGTTTPETPPPSQPGRPEDARTRTLPRSSDGPARPSYRVASVARQCPRNADRECRTDCLMAFIAFGVPAEGLSRSDPGSRLCASAWKIGQRWRATRAPEPVGTQRRGLDKQRAFSPPRWHPTMRKTQSGCLPGRYQLIGPTSTTAITLWDERRFLWRACGPCCSTPLRFGSPALRTSALHA